MRDLNAIEIRPTGNARFRPEKAKRSHLTAARHRRGIAMAEETGQITGTKDKDCNIIWFVEQCLSNVLRLETYI
jgi:hypothetical protein